MQKYISRGNLGWLVDSRLTCGFKMDIWSLQFFGIYYVWKMNKKNINAGNLDWLVESRLTCGFNCELYGL